MSVLLSILTNIMQNVCRNSQYRLCLKSHRRLLYEQNSFVFVGVRVRLLYIQKDLCSYFKGVRSKTTRLQRGSLWLETHHHRWRCAPAAVVSADTLSENSNTRLLMNLRPTCLWYTSYDFLGFKKHNKANTS